jgi:hypothetical protein
MARSDKHVFSSSCNSVVWAADRRSTSFTGCLAVSEVVEAVWVLDVAQVVVSGVVVAGVVAVVGGDVAVERSGSVCSTRGWGLSWCVVDRSGIQCRGSGAAGGGSEAGGEVVVVVVNDVGCADGGCAGVVSSDVAAGCGDDGLVAVSSLGAVCITALAVGVEVVCVLESVVARVVGSVCTRSSIRAFCGCVGGATQLSWSCFVSQTFRSAALPLSSPSFIPFLYSSLLFSNFPSS